MNYHRDLVMAIVLGNASEQVLASSLDGRQDVADAVAESHTKHEQD
jgi:hypothetical protein